MTNKHFTIGKNAVKNMIAIDEGFSEDFSVRNRVKRLARNISPHVTERLKESKEICQELVREKKALLIAGEHGCGKTSLALMISEIYKNPIIVRPEIPTFNRSFNANTDLVIVEEITTIEQVIVYRNIMLGEVNLKVKGQMSTIYVNSAFIFITQNIDILYEIPSWLQVHIMRPFKNI